MSSYNSQLQTNNSSLEEIITQLNNMPDAGGAELPELENEGASSDLLSGKQLIDHEGNVVEGTMPMGSAKTPATTITKNPSITVNSSGIITASVSGTQSVTPTVTAGYVSSGTAGTITVSGSATKQLTTKVATTYTPTTSNQIITAGTYCSGAQTIRGDSNLKASNIKSGVTIFGITGTAEVGGGESPTPSNPTAQKNEVSFYDYDGTILYSYTVEEAQALTELPPLPTHSGLTCQGWNYDLATIKLYNRAMDIGAMYITDDGKTRLYIRIAAEGRMTVPLYISQTVANGVTIDWGDGSSTQTLSGRGNKNTSHTYASIGDYVIALEVTSGTLGLGDSSSSYCVMGSTLTNGKVYGTMLQKVEIGSGITSIGNHAFRNCTSLTSITIPDSVTSIGEELFYGCYALSSITIPDSVTSIGEAAFIHCYSLSSITIPDSVTSIGVRTFFNCYSLSSITIPDSVTSIGRYTFNNCHSLSSITIPDSVTSIGENAFCYCYGMAIYDFSSHISVPTLSNTNAFPNISSDCIIKVPSALYDEWVAATNWATYASYIVAV